MVRLPDNRIMQAIKLQEAEEVAKELAEALVEVMVMLLQLLKVIREVQEEVEVCNQELESVLEVKCPSCITFKVKSRL